jgi:hypothetical protein
MSRRLGRGAAWYPFNVDIPAIRPNRAGWHTAWSVEERMWGNAWRLIALPYLLLALWLISAR